MSFKERIQLEKKEFQVLKKKYSFKNIQRVDVSKDEKETNHEDKLEAARSQNED
jgi:hypothetical protein